MSDAVQPFRIETSDDALDDLRRRLRATRWPERETVSDWSQGIPLAYVQEVCAYWAEKYDWRERERRLNAFPQFRTQIEDLGIHFVHVRSKHADALPIVITHGWPGSIVEFHKVIAPLADPSRFEVGEGQRQYMTEQLRAQPDVDPIRRMREQIGAQTAQHRVKNSQRDHPDR